MTSAEANAGASAVNVDDESLAVPEGWTPDVDTSPTIGEQPDELAFADDSEEFPGSTADSRSTSDTTGDSTGNSAGNRADDDAATPVVEAEPNNEPLALMLLAGLVLILGGLAVITKLGASLPGTKKS